MKSEFCVANRHGKCEQGGCDCGCHETIIYDLGAESVTVKKVVRRTRKRSPRGNWLVVTYHNGEIWWAKKWVGRAQWHFGSFYLWGDVPALMPITFRSVMKNGVAHRSNGETNFHTSADREIKNDGGSWFNIGSPGQKVVAQNPDGRLRNIRYGDSHTRHLTNPAEHLASRPDEAVKQGGDWFGKNCESSMSRLYGSKSPKRKAATAKYSKIPFRLAVHIARCFKPAVEEVA